MNDEQPEPERTEVTVYPDTPEALEVALEACALVAEGESVDAGDRDRFVKARTSLRVLRRELAGGGTGE